MKLKSTLIFLTLIVFSYSCSEKKDDKDDDKEKDEDKTEVGFTETCEPASVPAGLQVLIDGNMSSDFTSDTAAMNRYMACIMECAETETDPEDGTQCLMDCAGEAGLVPAGGAFSITLYLTNTTSSSITYIIEPGDWFEPGSGDYQPMMSPMQITIVILPGETTTVAIPVYCLASQKSAPDDQSDYTLCEMISENECLADIIDILETKDVGSLSYTESATIQEIIWKCTEGEEVDLDYLNALPDL